MDFMDGIVRIYILYRPTGRSGRAVYRRNEVWVRLIVSRPYSGKEVRSKAGNDRETEIDEIQLLVFEEGGI